ncbi:MAG TPA: hypothetical protein VGP76_06315 [Planctomycetaceae bacterium]|nr:hypothetical protein [Planctomycetaceae bacterium]
MIDVDFSPAFPERISFSSDGRLVACVLNDPTSPSAKRFVRVMKWRSEADNRVTQTDVGGRKVAAPPHQ